MGLLAALTATALLTAAALLAGSYERLMASPTTSDETSQRG
jgi:hypothetical protein